MSKKYLKIPIIDEGEGEGEGLQFHDTGSLYLHKGVASFFVCSEGQEQDAWKSFIVEKDEGALDLTHLSPTVTEERTLSRIATAPEVLDELRQTLLAIGEMSRGIRS